MYRHANFRIGAATRPAWSGYATALLDCLKDKLAPELAPDQ
jgi:hypothetical protein